MAYVLSNGGSSEDVKAVAALHASGVAGSQVSKVTLNWSCSCTLTLSQALEIESCLELLDYPAIEHVQRQGSH